MHFRVLIAAATLAVAPAALADPVTGTVSISGNDIFSASGITFNPSRGVIYQTSGTMDTFDPIPLGDLIMTYTAVLTNFQFSNAENMELFSATNVLGQTLAFTISNLLTEDIGSDSNGPTLSLSGTGVFFETGYDNTSGTFSLTSSTAGITGFQLVSNTSASAAVTPEPSGVALLGTGLLGLAGVVRKRYS